MDFDIVRNRISKWNPLNIRRKQKLRDRLTNHDMTILASNCIGGIVYSDLGVEFNSPTINLMIASNEFVKMCTNLEHYLSAKLLFAEDNNEVQYPIAKLDDITVHFTHYSTKEEAEFDWERRKKRIRTDNMFIMTNDRDGLTEEDILTLAKVQCRGVVVFTSREYRNIPCCLFIKKFQGRPCVGNVLKKNRCTGKRVYEEYFDYVSWFNNGDGNMDITPYKLKTDRGDKAEYESSCN